MLKAVDLFSGCGGLSLGFQNAGIDIRAAFENWEVAAKCYESNTQSCCLQDRLIRYQECN